jgi:hypothetical protein
VDGTVAGVTPARRHRLDLRRRLERGNALIAENDGTGDRADQPLERLEPTALICVKQPSAAAASRPPWLQRLARGTTIDEAGFAELPAPALGGLRHDARAIRSPRPVRTSV